MIKPPCLEHGMTIGIIAPASAARDPLHVDHAINGLKALDFKVKPGKHIRDRRGYLASTDKHRLADLHAMFGDKKVDAIMCLRGGYGAGRIVDQIDYDLVRKNPKVFIGFSDITILHLAFLRKSNLVTFNGPMAASTFADTPPSRFGVASFLRTICHREPAGSIWQEHEDRDCRVIRHGRATGQLTGGNLSLMAASMGTPYEMQTRGKIVFIEEVDEKPYRVDRMLTQLLSAGKLRDAAGIVIGRNVPDKDFADAEAAAAVDASRTVKALPKTLPAGYEPLMDEVFHDLLYPLGIPVITGLPFGHIDDYATLPLGVRASMDSRTGDLVIEESAVK